jgi:hypothetical protein
VKNAGKKPKVSEWKVLLGMALLLLGIASEFLISLQRAPIPGALWGFLIGLMLMLNGLGVIPWRRG